MSLDRYTYNLGQYFNEVAIKHTQSIALKYEEKDVTFGYLNSLSNKIANYLLSKNIKKNDVVAILNNKSIEGYALMIACLKIGVIYTNLDTKSPMARFQKMLTIANPTFLFYFENQDLVSSVSSFDTIKTINFESNSFKNTIDKQDRELPKYTHNVTGNSPAYIMFTSGSTGFPKGVVISHTNVINFINWAKTTYEISKEDVFTNINPLHFDNAVFDFYASLFNGASLIPINENLTKNPRRLIQYLNKLNPTIWFSVPSMLVYVLNLRALKKEDLATLRVVTFGGEGFPKNQLRQLWKFWGDRVQFINVYGPTECTCICSSYVVSEKDLKSDELLPLGKIAPNFYELVINDKNEEVADGEIGELYIGGENVGIGYYNNLAKTKEVFVKNPQIYSHTDIVYKSGDLVKKDTKTNVLYFCGRKDNQIKRMGYRIELEEIENAFNSIDFIEETAVVFIDNNRYRAKIIACLRSKNKDTEFIKKILKNQLPSYMMPDEYFYYEDLPKNQNGKINRLKLKEQFEI